MQRYSYDKKRKIIMIDLPIRYS